MTTAQSLPTSKPIALKRSSSSASTKGASFLASSSKYFAAKKVRFALKNRVRYSVAQAPAQREEDSRHAWYDESAYRSFLMSCRQTVAAAQQSLLATGTLSGLDAARHTVAGLEQYLSPALERQNAQRCRDHVQAVLRHIRLQNMRLESKGMFHRRRSIQLTRNACTVQR